MHIFFQKNNKKFHNLPDAIKAACEDLVYISETDAPVLAFSGARVEAVTKETILQQTGHAAETQTEEMPFDGFFERLTAIKDWFGEPEKARAKNFLDLQKLLEENLSDRKVFRMGRIRLDIYAVGIDKEGRLMGVTTKAVET